jgi:glycosyltransferase involved in cell wall biosynthesis
MVGICTRYNRWDTTHAALAIARHLDDVGRSSALLCYGPRTLVDPAYDNKVHTEKFGVWVKKLHHLVWTGTVDTYFLQIPFKQRIKNTLYVTWDQIVPFDELGLGAYNHVLVPTAIQALQLRDRFKLKNISILPYSCGYPITRRVDFVEPDCINLFLSLYGAQLERIDPVVIPLIAKVIEGNPAVKIHIMYSKGIASPTLRTMKHLTKKFAGRWKITRADHWADHATAMLNADLTLWPAKWDGLGLIGLTSLHMGTPVFAWDLPPFNEHLSGGFNALLVNCEIEYNWLGVPKARPNYQEFERVLSWILDSKAALKELKCNTHKRLEEWDTEFHKGLETILPME